MTLSAEEVRALAERAVAITQADAAEAVVMSTDSALTRFAGNRIHQNVTENNTEVSIRAVLGTRQGVAGTNRLDHAGLAACAAAAVDAAKHAPETSDFPGLPGDAPYTHVARDCAGARAYDARMRAEAAGEIIAASSSRGLTAAGAVARSAYALAVANSVGVSRATSSADLHATVLSMGATGGSGWASWLGCDTAGFSPAGIGETAALIAERSADPGALDPGAYAVVLAPQAVADILEFLAWVSFGAKAYVEGSSFLAGHVGSKLMDERISIADNALAPETFGLDFDFEGTPRRRTPLIERGVAGMPVTDSYYAATLDVPNTGHALPAPNPYGPLPLNLEMAAGDASESELLAGIERGVYVTRFHYVNVEDPLKVVLTGMTRDGTFLIENGEITRPLKNLRFTQGVLEAFSNVRAVGAKRALVGPGEGGATLAPALALESWEFTGQTG